MPAAALVRLVLLDARRSGLPWLAGASLLVGLSLAAFLSQVALTESRALQAAVLAALLRAAAVFLVAAHVAASTLREANDKQLELMLSLPLSRAAQYLGRLAGFGLAAALLAAAFAIPLLVWAPLATVALWAASLALECCVVAAATMFFATALLQWLPAIAATVGLYLLGRSVGAIQAIADGPLATPSAAHEAARWSVDAVAFLLPRLDQVTRTEWLLYGAPPAGAYLAALAGLAAYLALVAAAGLFDFYRRNF